MAKKSLSVKTEIMQIPGFFLGALGLGMSVMTKEAPVIVSFYTSPIPSASVMVFAATAVLFLLLGFVYRKFPGFRLHSRLLVSIIIALAVTVALFSLYKQGAIQPSLEFEIIFRAIINIGGFLLIVMWCEVMHPLGAKMCAYLFAVALAMIAVFCGVSVMLKSEAIASLIAVSPLVSIICLYFFKEKVGEFVPDTAVCALGQGVKSEVYPLGKGYVVRREHLLLVAAFVIFIVCSRMSFSSVFFLQSADETTLATSLASLLLSGSGFLVAGICIFAVARFMWGRNSLAILAFLVLAALFFSMNPNGTVSAGLLVVLTLPMSMGEILLCFLIVESPFFLSSVNKYYTFCVLVVFSSLGVVLNTLFSLLFSPEVSSVVAVAFVVVLAASVIYIFIAGGSAERKHAGDVEDAGGEGARFAVAGAQASQEMRESCERLARECQLTDRETDVLLLLANRYGTQDIAEILVLSASTVKTHMRNVYRKIDVHSQKELQDLVAGNLASRGR